MDNFDPVPKEGIDNPPPKMDMDNPPMVDPPPIESVESLSNDSPPWSIEVKDPPEVRLLLTGGRDKRPDNPPMVDMEN